MKILSIYALLCFVTISRADEVTFGYDSTLDVIYFEGKTYMASELLNEYFESSAASMDMFSRRKGEAAYAFHVFCTIACILFAALAAGLTMGLVSLEPFDMKILMEANEADCLTESERDELRREKAYAEKLYPLISRHHLLLVTLLLMNSIANEALPLFLNELVPPLVAVVISVTAVLVFGEILPSAIFTGPNQLAIGSSLAPLVWFFIYSFWIIAYPISLILDRMLGESTRVGTTRLSSKHLLTSTTKRQMKTTHEKKLSLTKKLEQRQVSLDSERN